MSSTSDSALFRIRSAAVDWWPFLGSWQLSVVLMVTAAFWFVLLAVFAFLSPVHVVQGIAGLAMFWLIYALLLANTAACIVIRFRTVAVTTILLHLSFFLVASGFILTRLSRFEAVYRVAEGEQFTGDDSQIVSRTAPAVLMTTPPSVKFDVSRITPRLWKDQLLFTSLEATLGDGRTTRINRPLILGPATFLRLSGFGYTPRYEIVDGRGEVLESSFVKLNVFPPGRRDFIASAAFPFRFYVSTDDLKASSFHVSIYRGRLLITQGTVKPGEPLAFEGLTFRIPQVRYWGEFTLVRDAGAPLIFLAFAVALGALTVKLWRSR